MFTVISNESVRYFNTDDQVEAEAQHFEDFPGDTVLATRPSTVREVMSEMYGEDWAKEDYRSGISHVAEVVNTYRTDGKDMLVIRNTGKNDVYGYDDTVGIANYNVLYDNWGHLEGFSSGPWMNMDVIGLYVDMEAPSDLLDVIASLEGYPLLDDDEHSAVEQAMIQEHWDSYGRHDVFEAVAEAIGAECGMNLTDYAEELITMLVWEGVIDYGNGGGYPEIHDASYVYFGEHEVAAYVKARLGLVVPVRTNSGYGKARNIAFMPNNLFRK